MTLKKSTRLMNYDPGATNAPSSKSLHFAFVCDFAGGESEKAKAKAVQNIPIAKPCVYTSIRIYRGIPCFRLHLDQKFEVSGPRDFSLSH